MGFPFNQDSSDIGNMEEGSNEYPANVISSVMRRAHTNLVKVKAAPLGEREKNPTQKLDIFAICRRRFMG